MPELVKIRSELFPFLYDAFLREDDPMSTQEDWRNIFDYQWDREEDFAGYAMFDGSRVIGMISMAFVKRTISGREHKFCNLHTWWVHEDYRGHSLRMLGPLLKLRRDHTITYFTPCDVVRALVKRMGFVELDMQMKVLLPLWPNRPETSAGALTVAFDGEIDRSQLSQNDLRIFQDHVPFRSGNLLIECGSEHCYILYTMVERFRLRYCHIQYVGNKELFERHEEAVRAALMRRHRVTFVVLDKRLHEAQSFRRSFDFWAPAHAMVSPADNIQPSEIDNLYSDIVMLKLAALPHVSYELGRLFRQITPGLKDPEAVSSPQASS